MANNISDKTIDYDLCKINHRPPDRWLTLPFQPLVKINLLVKHQPSLGGATEEYISVPKKIINYCTLIYFVVNCQERQTKFCLAYFGLCHELEQTILTGYLDLSLVSNSVLLPPSKMNQGEMNVQVEHSVCFLSIFFSSCFIFGSWWLPICFK